MKKRILALMLLGVLASNTTAYAIDDFITEEKNILETEVENTKYSKKTLDENILKDSIEEHDYFNKKEIIDDAIGVESATQIIQKTDKKFEIAIANDDGSFEYVDASDDINEIKEKFINNEKENLAIINNNRVVYSDYSLGRVIKHKNNQVAPITEITKLYPTSSSKNEYTYYNHGYIDDVPILEYANNRVKIQMNSYEGWVEQNTNSGNFEMVITPLNQIKNPSYFVNDNGVLKHFISSDLMTIGKGHFLYLGKAPEFMQNGVKYYSYDKEYFYNDLYKLIDDLKNNTHQNSVNSSLKFNSYYEYLSFRSKTNLSANEIDTFINNNTKPESKLRNIGQALKVAEEKYGTNAIALLGVAINESGWGMSKIAQEKNNIFGINAKDSSPGQSANYFENVNQCIDEFAKIWISDGYADLNDWRYNGSILGNKEVGANVRYASDPFWGEKATSNMYSIALNEVGNLAVGEANAGAQILNNDLEEIYTFDNAKNYFVVKELVNINGVDYYKINSELSSSGVYDWNQIALIKKEDTKIIWDNGEIDKPHVKPDGDMYWESENGNWYLYDKDGTMLKGMVDKDGYKYYLDEVTGAMHTGWVLYDNEYYYFASSGEMRTGWINDGWTDYYMNSDGIMHTGWLDDGLYKYYLDNNGQLRRGWVNDNGEYYYFGTNGEMKTGWINDGWTDYYLKSDGTIHKGWLDDGIYKYYLDNNGQLRRGWVNDNGEHYYFGMNGEMLKGWINDGWTDYYLKSDGTIHKGWLDDGMYKYFMDSNGQMKRGWHSEGHDWYYFGTNGEMMTGWINDGYSDYYMMSDGKLKPPIDIVDLNFEFNFDLDEPKPNNPQKLILHHAAGNTTVENVHNFHKYTNGWAGIGYHFYIHKDGTIYKGRNEEWRGAHAAEIGSDDGDESNDTNATSLGIAVQGDYTGSTMPKTQEDAVVKLGNYLVKKYGISSVFRHGDPGIGHTNCPGNKYPFERIKSRILSDVVYGVYSNEE